MICGLIEDFSWLCYASLKYIFAWDEKGSLYLWPCLSLISLHFKHLFHIFQILHTSFKTSWSLVLSKNKQGNGRLGSLPQKSWLSAISLLRYIWSGFLLLASPQRVTDCCSGNISISTTNSASRKMGFKNSSHVLVASVKSLQCFMTFLHSSTPLRSARCTVPLGAFAGLSAARSNC